MASLRFNHNEDWLVVIWLPGKWWRKFWAWKTLGAFWLRLEASSNFTNTSLAMLLYKSFQLSPIDFFNHRWLHVRQNFAVRSVVLEGPSQLPRQSDHPPSLAGRLDEVDRPRRRPVGRDHRLGHPQLWKGQRNGSSEGKYLMSLHSEG